MFRPGDWYMPGTGGNANGFPLFGFDYAVNLDYNFWALDPAYPPLGPFDIDPAGGLILKSFMPNAAIQATLLPATGVGNRAVVGEVTTIDSLLIKAPYFVSWKAKVPLGEGDWSALWMYSLKSTADQYAKTNEIDVHEFFSTDYTGDKEVSALHFARQRGDVPGDPGNYNYYVEVGGGTTGALLNTFRMHQAHVEDGRIRIFVDGKLTATMTPPPQADVGLLMYNLINMSWGYAYQGAGGYPSTPASGHSMTVSELKYYVPASNTSGVFPPAAPVPTLSWAAAAPAGHIASASTSNGLVLANLSAAASYKVWQGGFNGLAISGSNLVCSANVPITAGTYKFYIEGFSGAGQTGVPGIVAPFNLVVT